MALWRTKILQNLFVEVEEIIDVCSKLNLRMCFDVSHTSLTCNHLDYDFYEFATLIAPYTAHLHLGDAKGVNGEGLQIYDGELDFERLAISRRTDAQKLHLSLRFGKGTKIQGMDFGSL